LAICLSVITLAQDRAGKSRYKLSQAKHFRFGAEVSAPKMQEKTRRGGSMFAWLTEQWWLAIDKTTEVAGTAGRALLRPRSWLMIAGFAVCLYSLAVLNYVYTAPDLGLRSAFSPTLKAAPSTRTFQPLVEGQTPDSGDRVLRLGNLDIHTWPDLLAAPSRLHNQTLGVPTSFLQPWATRKRIDGEEITLVRATFQRDTGQVIEGWCVLGSLPLEDILPTLLWFFLKLSLFVIGALVFWKRPTEPTAALFFLLCIVTLGAYMGGYHWVHIATQPPLVLGFILCAALLPVVSLHFYLIFPRPKLVLGRHPRWMLGTVYGLPLLFLLALLALYLRTRLLVQGHAPVDEVDTALQLLRRAIYVYFGVAALWYLLSIAALIHSFRIVTTPTEHNQVKWILVGASLALLPISYSFYLAVWDPDAFGAGAATWPMFGASVCVTAAFAISITRYRLMELDKLISSGASYFFIVFLAGLVHYGVVLLGTLVFYQQFAPGGPTFTETLTVSLTVLVLMLVLDLARSRLRRALDRRFSREKYQLDVTLQRMGDAVGQLVDPPTVARRLLAASSELLGVTSGMVYLRHGEAVSEPVRSTNEAGVFRLAGTLGPVSAPQELPGDDPLIVTLHHQGSVTIWPGPGFSPTAAQRQLQSLGGEIAHALSPASPRGDHGRLLAVLILGPKDRTPFLPDDFNLLSAFAQVSVLALENALGHQTIDHLNRDLHTKVDKISEQQRRILALQSQLRAVGRGQRAEDRGQRTESRVPRTNDNGQGDGQALSSVLCPLPSGLVGSSPQLRQVLQLVRKVATNDKTVVLIRGESGTGKELLAQAVHECSPRAGKAFVKVHCAALSPTLLESELFGHVKGAFTGAHRDKVGRFELANGGTLFLDEIGDISLEVQTKLLHVLQERTFERVGSSEPLTVDVRILTATHQDLEDLIRQGRFREDLYYRLNVFPIFLPPLRERWEDLPELTMHFLKQAAQRCRKPVTHIDDDALAILKAYHWPGNIRQLENVIERAVVIAEGQAMTVRELPEDILREVDNLTMPLGEQGAGRERNLALGAFRSASQDPAEHAPTNGMPRPPHSRFERPGRERRERELLLRALETAAGNKAEAARALGLARSTLVSKLKKYGIS
jgi:transcriptional regulator with GAF, ATPase, and Fis domain